MNSALTLCPSAEGTPSSQPSPDWEKRYGTAQCCFWIPTRVEVTVRAYPS